MTLNPQANFMLRPDAKTWTDVVDSERFQSAASAALLMMQAKMGSAPDLATSSACYWRLEGARQFLAILMTLTDIAKPPTPKLSGNLEFAR